MMARKALEVTFPTESQIKTYGAGQKVVLHFADDVLHIRIVSPEIKTWKPKHFGQEDHMHV